MKTSLLLSLFVVLFLSSFSQVRPRRENNFSNLENIKVSYLLVNHGNNPTAQKYFKVLQDCWKLTPVEMISYADLKKKAARNVLFINTYKSVVASSKNDDLLGHLGIQYWSFSDAAINNPASLYIDKHGQQVFNEKAATEEYDHEVLEIPSDTLLHALRKSKSQDFDVFEMPEKYFYAWGEGIFRNRLQAFQQFVNTYIKGGKETQIEEDMKYSADDKEMAALKSQTLFVPSYIFLRDNMFDDYGNKPRDEETSMSNYKHAYKAISGAELNSKIMSDTKGFYYLYLKRFNTMNLTIEVINSKTGDVVYHQYYTATVYDHGMLKRLNSELK